MNSITRASQLADVALEDQAPSGKIAIGKLLYEAGRIKRKDAGSGNKFAEYLPYWA